MAIGIFPEGTRCKPGTTKGYKSGFLFVAENLGLKVVPVAVNTGLFWAKNSFLRYPGKIIYEFLPPIQPGLNKQEFMEKLLLDFFHQEALDDVVFLDVGVVLDDNAAFVAGSDFLGGNKVEGGFIPLPGGIRYGCGKNS